MSDPQGSGRTIERCARAINRAGARFVATRLKGLGKCAQASFTCVQTRPGDAACLSKAGAICDKQLGKLGTEATRLGSTLLRECGDAAVPFGILKAETGLNLETIHAACDAYGVSGLASLEDYAECLALQHACRVEELLRFAMPRAEALLDLVGRDPGSSSCPTP